MLDETPVTVATSKPDFEILSVKRIDQNHVEVQLSGASRDNVTSQTARHAAIAAASSLVFRPGIKNEGGAYPVDGDGTLAIGISASKVAGWRNNIMLMSSPI